MTLRCYWLTEPSDHFRTRRDMVFSSQIFLFLFLPVVLGLHVVCPRLLRNYLLLAFSLLFYVWGSGSLVVILLVSIVADYVAGRLAYTGRMADRKALIRIAVALSVALNLGLLGYFKYSNFMVGQSSAFLERLGFAPLGWATVALPIGISFFTFQSMSYTFDVAAGRAEPLRRPVDFALFVTLFPQLIAGPIVRFHEIRGELISRRVPADHFFAGLIRFGHGLAKKVLIADSVGRLADQAFASEVAGLTPSLAWLGIVAYTIQIYFDFSGYSDMAIGLGMALGFSFPENFRRPYSALSITDFWRRWHITLSSWFRDYLYLPLGGNRRGASRTFLNLGLVFVVTGLWHGANWTFLAWGLFHGALLIGERLTGQRPTDPETTSAPWLRRIGVLMAVMIGWVLFRSPTIGYAGGYLAAMTGFGSTVGDTTTVAVSTREVLALAVGAFTLLLPGHVCVGPALVAGRDSAKGWLVGGWQSVTVAGSSLAFTYTLVIVVSGQFSPFLYFQF